VVIKSIREGYNLYEFSRVTKWIYSFCNEELSSFYLDILKDRLYTSHASSQERRSAQTVLFHILNHFVRVLAPILAFTAEEVFQVMPRDKGLAEEKSVHLLDWPEVPQQWENPEVGKKFELLTELRPYILRALEDKRRVNEIGSSLEAKIVFRTASERDYLYLEQFAESLPSIFIVSQVRLEKVQDVAQGLCEVFPKMEILIQKAEGNKCCRCWNFRALGEDTQHPELCSRCAAAVRELTEEER